MPSDDRWLVFFHVPAGLVAVTAGATAMLASKGGRAHRRAGLTYVAALSVTCLSGVGLAITRWPHFPHLLVLGIVAALLASLGYVARHRPTPVVHLLGMGTSYTAMLTAFYVDNGPKLPLWRLLPPVAFWILPSLIALPLLLRAGIRYSQSSGKTRNDAQRGGALK
jgi:uncharacterized membrane protein